jgi:hypothetical protein
MQKKVGIVSFRTADAQHALSPFVVWIPNAQAALVLT